MTNITETLQRELDAAQARYDAANEAANAYRDAIMRPYYEEHGYNAADADDDDYDDEAEQAAYDAATEKADELFDALMSDEPR